MQDVLLAMLAKEPSHGYELRARLRQALGVLGESMNDGQVYVMLGRLERAGLVEAERVAGTADRTERKVYQLTAAGQQRVAEWLADVAWPKPNLADFHLKLVAAAASRVADPLAIVGAQRRELLRRLRDAQKLVLGASQTADGSAVQASETAANAALLLEGVVLRLEADLRWLDACESRWSRPTPAGAEGRGASRQGAER